MRPTEGAGRPPGGDSRGTAGQSTSATILADRDAAGKQAAATNVVDAALPDLAHKINEATTAAESHARSAMQHALTAGALLVQAKALVPHGEWQQWVEANCTIASRTASAYMRLAQRLPELPDAERQRVADLPVRDAIHAIATRPEPPPNSGGYASAGRRSDAERAVSAFRAGATALRRAARELDMVNRLKMQRAKSLRNALQTAIDEIDALTAGAAS